MLEYEEAKKICEQYLEGNNRLAHEFLGRGNLFEENFPTPYKASKYTVDWEKFSEFLSPFLFLVQLDIIHKNKEIIRILKEAESWSYAQDDEIEMLKQRFF